MRIRIALSDGKSRSTEHLGEAESIFLADKLNGAFITDDHAAYDLARRRLGDRRVLDTVDLLRETVVTGYFTPSEAQQVANAIRNSGRKLRRGHPPTFTPGYFEPRWSRAYERPISHRGDGMSRLRRSRHCHKRRSACEAADAPRSYRF